MRNILIFISIISISGSLWGQSAEKPSQQDNSAEETTIRLKQEGVLQLEEQDPVNRATITDASQEAAGSGKVRGDLGLSVGTRYSYSRGFGSGMMFYAAPTYTLPLNNRWSLHTGFIASHYQGMNSTYGEFYTPLQFSSLAWFAAASYRMSDKLVLHGAGIKNLVSAPTTPFTPYPMDNLSLGATYKLGNNISIGATIHINNGQGYYSSPYNGHYFNSPFFW